MHTRHFLVREADGTFDMREIDPDVASAVEQFGICTGHYYQTVEATTWTYYFVNGHMSHKRADDIARQLTLEFSQSMAQPDNA